MSKLRMFRTHNDVVNDNPYYDTTDHAREEYNDLEMIAYFENLWANTEEGRKENDLKYERLRAALYNDYVEWKQKHSMEDFFKEREREK